MGVMGRRGDQSGRPKKLCALCASVVNPVPTAERDSQEAIAAAVGLSRRQCMPYIKELVAEHVLAEDTGPHNRRIYRLPDASNQFLGF